MKQTFFRTEQQPGPNLGGPNAKSKGDLSQLPVTGQPLPPSNTTRFDIVRPLVRFFEELPKYLGRSWEWTKQVSFRKEQQPVPNPGGSNAESGGNQSGLPATGQPLPPSNTTRFDIVRPFIRFFFEELPKYPGQFRERIGQISFRKERRLGQNLDGPNMESGGNLSGLPVTGQSLPLSKQEVDWDCYALGSDTVIWVLGDSGATNVVAGFVTEIGWRPGTLTIPLEVFHDVVVKCFERSSGHPVVIPERRDVAYLSTMALLHLAIQCKCIGDESDQATLSLISARHQTMELTHYPEGDPDLESALRMIGHIFGDSGPILWEPLSITAQHHAQIARILLYCAWDIVKKGDRLPDYIMDFVCQSLHTVCPCPASVVADCFFIIGSEVGIGLCLNDLLVINKQ